MTGTGHETTPGVTRTGGTGAECEACGLPADACACPSLEEAVERDLTGSVRSLPELCDDETWTWDYPVAA